MNVFTRQAPYSLSQATMKAASKAKLTSPKISMDNHHMAAPSFRFRRLCHLSARDHALRPWPPGYMAIRWPGAMVHSHMRQ
ncbi:MAG: hypothetical protein IT440_00995 [Phycisphaeraceae bacterium]|nr:hypothetical protein [Phycisphaeraceae bacterium]